MKALPSSPACERNQGPILEVLEQEFAERRSVLEIGSGTGQHAVHFARAMPHLSWQTSDLPDNHAAISAWLAAADLENTRPPLAIDVESTDRDRLAAMKFDAVFSANTSHIMRIEAVAAMFELVGAVLPKSGIFCLYGPFSFSGRFSADSNAAFDASLRQRSPSMGIRDLERLGEFGRDAALSQVRLYAMPANNHLAIWEKQ